MSAERRPTEEPALGGQGHVTVLVDGHVHLHPRFDETRFFRSAGRNFALAARSLRARGPWRGVLVFTEVAGTNRFADLRGRVGGTVGEHWTVGATSEPTCLDLRTASGHPSLTVVAGRQIQTAEGLEVLAFPLADHVPDGRPVRDVLRQIRDSGAASMIPWGFGKWWGSRGRMLRQLVAEEPSLPFALADTGHRPSWAPGPELLDQAARHGRIAVTGSDPLPFPGEETRAGSCCFALEASRPGEWSAEDIKEAVLGLHRSPRRHEQRVPALRFAVTQVAMQLRKRAG